MFRRLFVFLILMSIGLTVAAQDDITLIPFTNDNYGIQGLAPEGWLEVQTGTYVRGSTATDNTLILYQAAPLSLEQVTSLLIQQLGLESAPEDVIEYETAAFTWQVYAVPVDSPALGKGIADLALTNADGKTYIVLFVVNADEHEALHESIFIPALDALAPLVEEAALDVPYIQEEVTFTNGDVTLAGTLTIPSTAGPHPAIILVSGSGAQDRDESLAPVASIKPFQLIADHLTRNGIAVLRYDDRGAGMSTGDYMAATIYDFADDARAGIAYLMSREDINSEQVGMLGHSEGGVIAPMIARDNADLAFIISMAGTGMNFVDVYVEQIYRAIVLSDESEADAYMGSESRRIAMELILMGEEESARDFLQALFVGGTLLEMAEDEATTTGELLKDIEPIVEQTMEAFTSPEIYSLMEYDPSEDWQAATIPVLALYGGLDFQVPAEMNVSALEQHLANNPDYTVITFPTANHLFQEAVTGGIEEYGTLEQTFMPDFLPTITDWLLERVG